MKEKLKVVNLCSNRLLICGIQEVFANCEDIVYFHANLDNPEWSNVLHDADVLILEESIQRKPEIQELLHQGCATSVFLNLNNNDVTVVYRKQVDLQHVGELIQVVRKCKAM